MTVYTVVTNHKLYFKPTSKLQVMGGIKNKKTTFNPTKPPKKQDKNKETPKVSATLQIASIQKSQTKNRQKNCCSNEKSNKNIPNSPKNHAKTIQKPYKNHPKNCKKMQKGRLSDAPGPLRCLGAPPLPPLGVPGPGPPARRSSSFAWTFWIWDLFFSFQSPIFVWIFFDFLLGLLENSILGFFLLDFCWSFSRSFFIGKS